MMALLEELFLGTLRMSAGAALCVAAVLLIRLLLRKAPRVFSYALWAVVLFRLLCPFVPKTPWSPMPSAEIVPVPDEKYSYVTVSTGIQAVDGLVNDYLYRHPIPQRETNVARYPTGEPMVTFPTDGEPPLTWVSVGSLVWLAGLLAMLLWGAVSMLRLRWKLREAVKLEGERDIWLADHIPTAFLWGGLFPRIYLPSDLPENIRDYVVRHERLHASRGDHLIRMAAWLALVIHWFNPLVWLAFWLAGRDMEMSCDEMVLRQYSRDVRADYAASLLRLSAGKRLPVGPLAFGDSDPKGRIKNVLNYKKPAFWVTVAALAAVIAAGAVLVTGRPFRAELSDPFGQSWRAVEAVYSNPLMDALPPQGLSFSLSKDGELTLSGDNAPLLTLVEGEMDGSGFRSCFSGHNGDGWVGGRDLSARLIRENACFWEYVWENDGGFWALLQQKDGTLYLIDGWYDPEREQDPASDDSCTWWILRLEPVSAQAAGMSYSLNERGCVAVNGLRGGRAPVWIPPEADDLDPLGVLMIDAPFFLDPYFVENPQLVSAAWTDESRTAVEVSFLSVSSDLNVLAAMPCDFIADLSAGTVELTDWNGSYLVGETPHPYQFTDGEMLAMAQTLAEIIRGAEGFYAAQN